MEVITLRAASYVPTWEVQQTRARDVTAGRSGEALFLVEHTPVYTLGRRTDPGHLLQPEEQLRGLGAELVHVDRGGDVTWHGPGQITAYPIVDLRQRNKDVHRYVQALEQIVIDVAAMYGIEAGRADRLPGVWVAGEKLAALGVKVMHGWVTYHGFALNVSPDLAWFKHIVPCGLHESGVTSLSRLLGRNVSWEDAAERVERAARLRLVPPPPHE